MDIEEKALKWFIQKVIAPRHMIIDHPGFIAEQFSIKNEKIFLRQICVPENILVKLENTLINKYGDKGKQILYSIGKRWSYGWCKLSKFPTTRTLPRPELIKFVDMMIMFLETISYGKIKYKIDFDGKTAVISYDDFIVCPHNGYGYVIAHSGPAGIAAYILADKTIEGVQVKCLGQGDDHCEIVCARPEILRKKGLKVIKETNFKDIKSDPDYDRINAIKDSLRAEKSFKDLIDSRLVKYSRGLLQMGRQRYFIVYSEFIYLMEKEVQKLKDGEKILFNVSKNIGKQVAEEHKETVKDYKRFIIDLMSSFGFGEITLFSRAGKMMVLSRYFPWSIFAKDISFVFYRGFLSGLLSGLMKKNITLKSIFTDLSEGPFSLGVTE